jgi:ABC-type polysaccharide/polyol phosphate transport system ATPase subunit
MTLLSSPPIIYVANLAKRYDPGQYRLSIRTELSRVVGVLTGRHQQASHDSNSVWALRNVSFTIHEGEAVGIIGRNGSGKTTLLRILSGITEPTEGTVEINSSFVNLIGLSAGFDFERTGLENIYLNAAIFGVPSRRTSELLDSITEFSELGEHLQTPIKYYSSGMIARLGFSVAINIAPKLLILDEVLAVGDAPFQEKCFKRILELKASHSTILFVSHSDTAFRRLCDRVIWLQHGQVVMDGTVEEVLSAYEQNP